VHTPSLIAVSFGAAALASIIAAATDARTGRIPNWLTLPAAAVGILSHLVMGGKVSVGISLLGLLLAAVVPAILYRVSQGRAIGGGDVKLFASLGAMLGPTLAIEAELGAFVLLTLFALIRLTLRGALWCVLVNSACLLTNLLLPPKYRRPIEHQALTEMRLGPAIACSVVSTLTLEHLGRMLPWLS